MTCRACEAGPHTCRASRAAPRAPESDRFDCLSCGTGVKADEEGSCAHCGHSVVVIRAGVPDYRAVATYVEDYEAPLAARPDPGEEGLREALANVQRVFRHRDIPKADSALIQALHLVDRALASSSSFGGDK